MKLLKPEPEPTSPDWRKSRQNQGKSPLKDNPSKERITKASDEPNWRNRKTKESIREIEFPPIEPITEAFIEEIKINDKEEQKETKKCPKPSVEEEYDEEEWKTQTLHPIDEDENTLLMAFINEDKQDQEIWINRKTNLAMDLVMGTGNPGVSPA